MNMEYLRTVERLFQSAADLPPDRRMAYVQEHAGDNQAVRTKLESMLAHLDDEGDSPLKTPVTYGAPQVGPGDHVGRYKLLQQIGEGGMSLVYLAEQSEPVRRKVALKILKPGMDSKQVLARFELERKVLALFNHPHVARVFDAGMTDNGRPYFVMEHVEGLPLTRFCDQQRLTTNQRLELFISVCEAVQHAHQKGIIHRDIKPGNILVALQDGKPLPKVIDFGIAKATGGELTERTLFTEQSQLIGTPEYMSPEQAEMSELGVDTRTDIYSLGVVLYELLAGLMPFDPAELRTKSPTEIQRTIREVEPNKPSTRLSAVEEPVQLAMQRGASGIRALQRQVCGDLDWIVMKCLEKDRARRYETANALAMDIRRYLTNEPVLAGPPSRSYRLRKFVVRNRSSVAAAVLVTAALVIGFSVAFWQAVRANREAARAEQQWQIAEKRQKETEQVAEFQKSQLAGVKARQMGGRLRRDIIDRRRSALELAGLDEAEIEQGLLVLEQSLDGVDFVSVAKQSLDENIFDPTLQAIEQRFAEQPLVKARLLQSVANSLRGLQILDQATAVQEQALEIRRRELGDAHPDTLKSFLRAATLFRDQSKLAEAEAYARRVVDSARHELGSEHRLTLSALNNLGVNLHAQGRYAESAECFGEVFEIRRRLLGEEQAVQRTGGNLAFALHRLGRFAEAEALYRQALHLRRRVHGNQSGTTMWAALFLGTCLCDQGKLEEAEPFVREALEGFRSLHGDEHFRTQQSMSRLANLLRDMGQLEEAERLGAEAVAKGRHTWPDERPQLGAWFLLGHAQTLILMKRFEQAEIQLLEALAMYEDTSVPIENPASFEEFTNDLAAAGAELYDAWHTAEPDQGYDAKAAEWRAKLERMQTGLQTTEDAEAEGGNHADATD